MFYTKIASVLDISYSEPRISSRSAGREKRRDSSFQGGEYKSSNFSLEALAAQDRQNDDIPEDFEALDLSADPVSEKYYSEINSGRQSSPKTAKQDFYTEKYLGYEPVLPRSQLPPAAPRPQIPARVTFKQLAYKQVELYHKYALVAQARARILKLQNEKIIAKVQIQKAQQLRERQNNIQRSAQQQQKAQEEQLSYWHTYYQARRSKITEQDREIQQGYRQNLSRLREKKRALCQARKREEQELAAKAARWSMEDAEQQYRQLRSFKQSLTHSSEAKRSEYAQRVRDNGRLQSKEQLDKVEREIREQELILEKLLSQEELELVECVQIKQQRVSAVESTLL